MTPERLEQIRKIYYDTDDPNSEWRVSVDHHINNAEELLDGVDELLGKYTKLKKAAVDAYERLAGDAKDGNLGWHQDHPIVANLREALEDNP